MATNKPLEFSYNWNNKLSCKAFTTLRLSDRFNIGDKVEVYLLLRKLGTADVVNKIKIQFGKISDTVAYLDTGYNAAECRNILQRMYKNMAMTNLTTIYLYVLVYKEKEPDPAVQGNLFDSSSY